MRRLPALIAVLCIILTGCVGSEDLMLAPHPAIEYTKLQEQIDALITGGYTYSAPATGDYRQAVQLYDLTGDGSDEVVVFLRNETENIIAVFMPDDDGYTALPPLSENAESIHSITFCDFNLDGVMEIVVGWQLAGLRSLSVYHLENGNLSEVISKPYSSFTVYDIEGSGQPSLIIIQVDASEQKGVVEMYTERNNDMTLTGTANLSRGAEAVLRVRTSPLSDGKPGFFVASKFLLSEISLYGEITDVFTFRDGALINISMHMESGISETLVRQLSISAVDIDNDGILDLPRPVELPRHPDEDEASSDTYYEIYWGTFDSNGLFTETVRSYHSIRNNWYLTLPDKWPDNYVARRSTTSGSQNTTTFSIYNEGETPVDFLKIFYITRSAGDRTQVKDRTVLIDQPTLLVVAELYPLKGRYASSNITEAELKSLFSIIPTELRSGA